MLEVLIIDDDPGVSAGLTIRLRASGFSTRSASNGIEGLKQASQSPPDAVILDVRMPGMNGIEVCQRLMSDDATSTCPVLFLSAETSEEIRERAIVAGGRRFITKPYQAEHVISVIRELVVNQT